MECREKAELAPTGKLFFLVWIIWATLASVLQLRLLCCNGGLDGNTGVGNPTGKIKE